MKSTRSINSQSDGHTFISIDSKPTKAYNMKGAKQFIYPKKGRMYQIRNLKKEYGMGKNTTLIVAEILTFKNTETYGYLCTVMDKYGLPAYSETFTIAQAKDYEWKELGKVDTYAAYS